MKANFELVTTATITTMLSPVCSNLFLLRELMLASMLLAAAADVHIIFPTLAGCEQ